MNRGMRWAASIAVFGLLLAGCSQTQEGTASGAEVLTPQGDEVVGATTIKRIEVFRADGSIDPAVASVSAEGGDAAKVCEDMVGNPAFAGLSRCGDPQAGHPVSFCSVSGDVAFCPLTHVNYPTLTFGAHRVVGPYVGTQKPLVGDVPWAVDLEDGSRCSFAFSMLYHPGHTDLYHCSGGAAKAVWGRDGEPPFEVTSEGWIASYNDGNYDSPLSTAKVTTAYFLESQ